MPDVVGYSQTDDPEWVRAHLDDGSSVHVNDPDSSWRAQHPEMSPGAEQNPTVTDPTTGQVMPAVETPKGDGTLLPNLAADYGLGARPPEAPAAAPPAPGVAAEPGGAAPASASPDSMTPQVITIPGSPGQSVTTSNNSVTGLTKEGKQSVGAAYDAAASSQAKSDAETVLASTAIHQHAYDTAVAKQAEIQGQVDAEKREKATRDALVSDELRRIQERNAQPIDMKAAFKTDGMGGYALLASIGESISNIGDRLNGRKGEDVLKPINDIIDRSVKLQLAQKQADFEAGRLTLAAYQAQAQETTSHLYALANQLTLAQAKVADTEEEKMGVQSLSASLAAKRDAAAVTAATAIADHRTAATKTVSKSGTPDQHILSVPGGGADASVDQKLLNDTLDTAYPGMKPNQKQAVLGKFTSSFEKSAAMNANVESLTRDIKALPSNDLPGHGAIASHLPNFMVSNEGVAMRQRIKGLIVDYARAEGARVNPADIAMMSQIVEGAKDKRSLLTGLAMLKGHLTADEHEMQAHYPKLYEAKKFIQRRQGQGRAQSSPGYEQQQRAAVPLPGSEPEAESGADSDSEDGEE